VVIDDSLSAQAQVLAAGINSSDGQVTFQGSDTLPGETREGIAVAALLVDAQGTVLDRSGQAPSSSAVSAVVGQALQSNQPVFQTLTIGGVEQRVRAQHLTTTAAGKSIVLVVSRSTAEKQTTLAQATILLGGVVALLTLVGSILGYRIAGRALRPVRVIAATARDISEHDLDRRLDMKLPRDELGELGDTFNQMLGRLDAAFGSLQRFTADAAHELRAPLAVMRSEVEVTLAQDRSTGQYRESLQSLGTEIERLARLADQLLVLARADAQALHPRMEPLDVADFLEEVVDRWRPHVANRGLRLESHLPDSGSLRGDSELLRRVLDSLLDNAVKYSPAGTVIDVTASRADGNWRIAVSDQGPGVPAELRPHLFERFTRGDPARARHSGGAGLGLALAAAIVHAHGGSLTLEDGPGARFVASLSATSG
jgi:heavy metal sensor kinase